MISPEPLGQRQIAIAASFTAEPLEPALRFWLGQFGDEARVAFAPYHQVFQALLDARSVLGANALGANVVFVRLEDWHLRRDGAGPADSASADIGVERSVREFEDAVRGLAKRSAVPLLVVFCPTRDEIYASPAEAARFATATAQVATRLVGVPGVHTCGPADVDLLYPTAPKFDPRADKDAHAPYTSGYWIALATFVARKLHAITSPPYKAIVVDCDGTLWDGVVGEDGPLGVRVDESRRMLQRALIESQHAGMLLCLSSKNAEEDVLEVLEKHPDMSLKREHLTAWRVNWDGKGRNLKELAAEINVGLDSMLFLDDSPIECASVRAECPEVTVVELPRDSGDVPRFVAHLWPLDVVRITEEDRARTRAYRTEAVRQELLRNSPSFDSFIAGLNLEVSIAPPTNDDIARISQLTQRTNQFNTTTVRRMEAEIRRLVASESVVQIVRVRDRFGDYGLVGAWVGVVEGNTFNVDSLLLSCRVLGRGVEHRVAAHIARVAADRRCAVVRFDFVETRKNQPALEFLREIGGRRVSGGAFDFDTGAVAATMFAPSEERHGRAPAVAEQGGHSPAGHRERADWAYIATDLATVEGIRAAMAPTTRSATGVARTGVEAPRTPTETKLLEIFCEVLSADQVGIRDSFFDVGGHSVLALSLLGQLNEAFDTDLELVTVFEAPSVAELAAEVDRARAT